MAFLGRLQARDAGAWVEMDPLYKSMMKRWQAKFRLAVEERDDLTQEIMLFIARHVVDGAPNPAYSAVCY